MRTIIGSIPFMIRMDLLMSREKIVKTVREEVIMIRVHKTNHKESIYIKDVEDIKAVKQGSSMGKIFGSTNDSNDAFLQGKEACLN